MSGTASLSAFRSEHKSRRDLVLTESVIRLADQLIRIMLAIIIFAVPLTMAGVKETGVALFVCASYVMAAAWAVRHLFSRDRGASFSGALLIGFSAIAGVSFQLVELPAGVLHLLSPFVAAFFSGAKEIADLDTVNRISLTPGPTKSGLILLVGYVTFFSTMLQVLRTRETIDTVLQYVALSTAIMAVVGIAQMIAGNGDFLWLFNHPLRSAGGAAKGTFTNQNHFAHFLALGVGPLIWCWVNSGLHDGANMRGRVSNRGFGTRRDTDVLQMWMSVGIAVVALAGILSLSRGGIAVLIIAFCVSLFGVGSQSKGVLRECVSWRVVFRLIVPVVFMTILGVTAFGTDMLETRWARLSQAQSFQDISRGRYLLWAALLKAAPWFWPLGSGVGSHAEVYPTWFQEDFGKRFSHAESGYLQILVETGIFGLLLVGGAILLIVRWCLLIWAKGEAKDRQRSAILMSGLVVSVLHSLADFVWYIPACMICTLLLAACLCRQYQLLKQESEVLECKSRSLPQLRWPMVWACVVVFSIVPTTGLTAGVLMSNSRCEQPWLQYRRLAVDASSDAGFGEMESVDQRLAEMIRHLERCLEVDPENCTVRSELAGLYLRRFEKHQLATSNPVSVAEIRHTVLNSEFQNPREVADWLRRAFGENALDLYRSLAMARTAMVGQPLRGENYLVLSQLNFLLLAESQVSDVLISQSLRLRPYQTEVLYLAGLREAEKGQLNAAIQYWLRPFKRDGGFREAIIRSLAPYTVPEDLIQSLELDTGGAFSLFRYYAGIGDDDGQRKVASWYEEEFSRLVSDRSEKSRQFWYQSHELLSHAGDTEKSLFCLASICEENPSSYAAHRDYGLALLDAEANSAARRQLEWCRLRNPDDRVIATALETLSETPTKEFAVETR